MKIRNFVSLEFQGRDNKRRFGMKNFVILWNNKNEDVGEVKIRPVGGANYFQIH